MTKKWKLAAVGVVVLMGLVGVIMQQLESPAVPTATNSKSDLKQVPVPGMVTMLDLGATECVPCKMMAPILDKLEKVYRNKAAIIFIDVWKHREQAGKYGIRAIPTQIFYDAAGKEVYRHQGFLSEAEIIRQLQKMGVN